ncbi:MAG: hypothetical protein KF833_02100 [Verrucomicrobiae bacterium]|nr:hypothetical protein [Verrucomicrobiae bacterium]
MALDADGTVWAWGSNSQGQLGDGTRTGRRLPIRVLNENGEQPLRNIRAIAAASGGFPGPDSGSEGHSLALDSDGTVWAWGSNSNGQLGDGTTAGRLLPGRVLDETGLRPLENIVAIAANNRHSLALDAAGAVWAWGSNGHGQLGDGTRVRRTLPGRVQFPTDTDTDGGPPVRIVAIVSALYHILAQDSDGMLWSWGHNDRGQVGDGTMGSSLTDSSNDRLRPVAVRDSSGGEGLGRSQRIVAVAGGGRHSYALDAAGLVWAWGINIWGELGDNSGRDRAVPGYVLANADEFIAFDLHLMASIEGPASIPAENASAVYVAQQPDGALHFRIFDERGAKVIDLPEAGISDEKVRTLIRNRLANLWDREEFMVAEKRPVMTSIAAAVGYMRTLTDIVSIAGGAGHGLAVTSDGAIWGWGSNASGQLAVPGSSNRLTPVRAQLPAGEDGTPLLPVTIAAGNSHSVAIFAPAPRSLILEYDRLAEGVLTLIWQHSDGAEGVVLEQSTSLDLGSWTSVSPDTAGRKEVDLKAAGTLFFRLRKP